MSLVTTVSTDQGEILRNVSRLYLDGRPFQADLTWGSGGFWRYNELMRPPIRMDLEFPPRGRQLYTDDDETMRGGSKWKQAVPNVIADIRALPFLPGSLRSCVVDLPFIHAPGKASVMGQRFSGYPSQRALNELHWEAAHQISWVMQPGGIVVWKCQDIIESSKQVWNHIKIHMHATASGLHAQDLFILHRSRSGIVGWNQHKQQHARRTHCYFWIFKRG